MLASSASAQDNTGPQARPVGVPRPVDVHVGARLRQRRTLIGMSQEKLGEAVGLTFQQIQKYERGANRIGASRLFELSQILDVPVSYFFEDMSSEVKKAAVNGQRTLPETSETGESDPLMRRETLELVRAYYRIEDPKVRKRLFELAKAIANGEQVD